MATAPMADTEPTRFDVVVAQRATEPVWWAPLAGLAESVIASIPTHRDTKSGRRNASQIRLVMLSSGILVVVLWNSPWAPLALFLCLGALIVPMSETRRRTLRAKVRSRKTQPVVSRVMGELNVEERHVTLEADGERLRRIRRTVLELNERGEALEVRGGAKKRDRFRVWLGDGGDDEDDLWVECDDIPAIEAALR